MLHLSPSPYHRHNKWSLNLHQLAWGNGLWLCSPVALDQNLLMTQWIILFPVISPYIQKFSRISRKICNIFFPIFTPHLMIIEDHTLLQSSQSFNVLAIFQQKTKLGIPTIFNQLSWHWIMSKLGIIIPKTINSQYFFLCNFWITEREIGK